MPDSNEPASVRSRAKPKRPAGTTAPAKTGKTRVRSHTRTSSTGKTVKVRAHDRRVEWKKAAAAWGGAAAGGATSAALVLNLGFALISTVCILLTLLLTVIAAKATAKQTAPKRRMRAKTRPKSRTRSRSTTRRRR